MMRVLDIFAFIAVVFVAAVLAAGRLAAAFFFAGALRLAGAFFRAIHCSLLEMISLMKLTLRGYESPIVGRGHTSWFSMGAVYSPSRSDRQQKDCIFAGFFKIMRRSRKPPLEISK
jgi:hypothetical protein